jgi:4-amino-4-deoxy-L-arabinose transferase-like glycosyltransferase
MATVAEPATLVRPVASVPLRRWFWTTLVAMLLFRLWLAWWLPMTGDEAYFIIWGRAPGIGFYDHPPMVGWILAALLKVSQSALWLRLPAVLLPAFIALGMLALIGALARNNPDGSRIAYAGALAWLLAPPQVINVLVTTDTPLILFSALAMALFVLAVRSGRAAWYAAAGVALGLAFLSKYFAVLVGFAFIVFAVVATAARDGKAPDVWRGLALTVLAALPFGLINLWWNYGHCWTNVLFNVYTRNADAGFEWRRPLAYAASVVYLSSPILLWQLARNPKELRRAAAQREWRLLAVLAFAPLAAFALIAPFRDVGLHWLLGFMPALFACGALALGADRLLTSVKFLAALASVHIVALMAVAALPIETFKGLRQYNSLVQTAKGQELLAALKAYEGKYMFAANSFSRAARLSYEAALADFVTDPLALEAWRRHYVFVLGSISHHGRHDDILTDARALSGRDVLDVRNEPVDVSRVQRWFRTVQVKSIQLRGTTFYLMFGHGFDYDAYRDTFLTEARDRFYRVPAFLARGQCYYCERYFGTQTCPLREPGGRH